MKAFVSVCRHFMSQNEEKRSSLNLQAGKAPGPLSDAYFSDNYLLSASVTSLQSRLNLNAAQFGVFPAAARITTLTADPLLVRHSDTLTLVFSFRSAALTGSDPTFLLFLLLHPPPPPPPHPPLCSVLLSSRPPPQEADDVPARRSRRCHYHFKRTCCCLLDPQASARLTHAHTRTVFATNLIITSF